MSTAKPGEMHPVDQAFYDLTVKQRDLAWAQVERLTTERDAALKARDGLRAELLRVQTQADLLHTDMRQRPDAAELEDAWAATQERVCHLGAIARTALHTEEE